MSYIALYRKYRPLTFDGIVGRENITEILKNQIKSGKISHAYLFSGTRGTGKTSAAKVFARAINCLHPVDGEPCNECEVCKNILEGNTTDVVEMDAASNNSVENIRQIRQEVMYATVDVKYRVYIIDEVHMLTISAFNALLKTLEEPPENVVFILATTEQHKIPVTILSRCLRFEFNRLSDEDIVGRLKYVLENEKVDYEEKALNYIAKLADGAMRDALSILERCITEIDGKLMYDDVLQIVGAIDSTIIQNIVDSIYKKDSIEALKNIDIVINKGKDLRQLSSSLAEEFLNILISKENSEEKDRITSIIDRLSKLDNDLKQTSRPSIVFKSAIVELCSSNNLNAITSSIDNNINTSTVNNQEILSLNKKITLLENNIKNLNDKIKELENKKPINTNNLASNINVNLEKQRVETKNNSSYINKNKLENVENIDIEDMTPFSELDDFKRKFIENGKIKLYSALAGATACFNNETFCIITKNSFAYSMLKTEDSIDTIKSILSTYFNINKNVVINYEENNDNTVNKAEKLFKDNNIDYTDID